MSICVPYWERQAELDRMFENYAQMYGEGYETTLNLEFSVCDDGSPTQPAKVPTDCLLTRLPKKSHPLNPCTPINAAVMAATGEIIVLTNPEIEHREPVLHEMRCLLGAPQAKRYVVARCRQEGSGGWLAGPDVDYTIAGREPVPPGGHFHYLVMCWRRLWNQAGGFDEDYRMGQACDDNDWLWRLARARAEFVTTQGVVWHRRSKRLKWKLPHNRGLLHQKWPGLPRLDRKRKNVTNNPEDRGPGVPGERDEVYPAGGGRDLQLDGVVPMPGDAQPGGGGSTLHTRPARAATGHVGVGGAEGGLVGGEVETVGHAGRVSAPVLADAGAGRQDTVPGVRDALVDADGRELAGRGACDVPTKHVDLSEPYTDAATAARYYPEWREGLLHPEWALVLGGGEFVWDEVLAWEALYGRTWDGLVVVANDAGSHWPRALDHWATLHPDRLRNWQDQRAAYGFSDGYETWGRSARHVDHCVRPWAGGSSGMLAIQVSQIVGCTKAVLCGIPMTPTPHFTESILHASGRPWTSVAGHWRAWLIQMHRMQGWVRSMSGRTQETLGTPTLAWLHKEVAT